jgi:hypothetical protein
LGLCKCVDDGGDLSGVSSSSSGAVVIVGPMSTNDCKLETCNTNGHSYSFRRRIWQRSKMGVLLIMYTEHIVDLKHVIIEDRSHNTIRLFDPPV